jgi:hypothetical protein
MSSYTKWDRAAYIDRVGGEEEAERRRKVLMARQSGHRLAEERKRHCGGSPGMGGPPGIHPQPEQDYRHADNTQDGGHKDLPP